mgnify:CR=1 FL=1|tara:strand:+ start:1133 stop:1966 length:834 start_codon:yes stop_codon:yes gene_type:complete
MKPDKYTPAMIKASSELSYLSFTPTCLNQVTVLSVDKVRGKIHGVDESCCAALSRGGLEGATHLVVRLMPDQVRWDRVVNQDYLSWLVGDSCISSYYLEDSVEEVLKSKSVVIRCDVPASLMMAAVQMFRYIWEFPEITKIWSKLVEVGVDKDHAFVVAHHIRCPEHPALSPHGVGNTNHHVFGSGIGVDVLDRFKTLSPFTKDELFSVRGKYSWIQNAWEGGTEEGSRTLYEELKDRCSSGTRKVSHAFGTSQVEASEDLYTQIKKAIDEITKEKS